MGQACYIHDKGHSHPYKMLKLPYYSYHKIIKIMPLCEHTGQAHNYIWHSVLESKKKSLFGRTHCQDRIKKFPKLLKPSQNSKHQISNMKKNFISSFHKY